MNPSSSSFNPDVIKELVRNNFGNETDYNIAMRNIIDSLGIQDSVICFFGFQGLLANKFTLVKAGEEDEVRMRCFALDDTVSPVFQNCIEFYEFYEKYNTPQSPLTTIDFDSAMQELRLGEKLQRTSDKFEDVEVDEFDDDCTEECLPGSHKCGK